MAEKKFAGINGAVASPEVSADYEAATVFDKVKVGKLGVYFRDGFKVWLPCWSGCLSAFRRSTAACAAAIRFLLITGWCS